MMVFLWISVFCVAKCYFVKFGMNFVSKMNNELSALFGPHGNTIRIIYWWSRY